MTGWILNLAYAALLLALTPSLLYRGLTQGKYRSGWTEKLLGLVPRRESRATCVWFHAVSVGEVLLLRTIIDRLRGARPDVEVWISTTTQTGHAMARQKFPDCRAMYFPFDFTWAVRNALRRVRPDLIVLVELELWPNLVRAAADTGTPVVLVNGRISERSFRGYRRLRFLTRPTLRRFARLAVQTEQYRQRLIELGAAPDRTLVTGSVKFDGVETSRNNPHTQALRAALRIGDGDIVFIAGSTQAPEEEHALQCYLALRVAHPELRLVLVPRHKERFEEVAALVREKDLPLLRRSELTPEVGGRNSEVGPHSPLPTPHSPPTTPPLHYSTTPAPAPPAPPVLLLDTLGELSACWGLADVAFVGGSLTNRGGQNMIEPCAYGAAVLFGPNTSNFRHVVELLVSGEAAMVIQSGEALTAAVRRLLGDHAESRALGRRAQQLVCSQQGATGRTVEILRDLLPPRAAARSAA